MAAKNTRPHGGTPPLEPHERRAWRAFITVAVAMSRRLDHSLMASHGITLDDYGLMAVLMEKPDRRERFGRLAKRLRIPKANLTYRFQRLEKRGLVRRAVDDSDSRGAFAILTGEGGRLMEEATGLHTELVREHFLEPLGPAALARIETQMMALVRAHPPYEGLGLRP